MTLDIKTLLFQHPQLNKLHLTIKTKVSHQGQLRRETVSLQFLSVLLYHLVLLLKTFFWTVAHHHTDYLCPFSHNNIFIYMTVCMYIQFIKYIYVTLPLNPSSLENEIPHYTWEQLHGRVEESLPKHSNSLLTTGCDPAKGRVQRGLVSCFLSFLF